MKVKKIIVLLLIISLVFSFVPAHIFATSVLKFTITPSATEVHPGDEITYTVKMSAVQNLASIKFKLVIPEGLTFIEGKEVEGLQSALHAAKAEFTPSTKVFVVGSSNYSSSTETTLMTFKCSVNNDTIGDKEIAFIIDEDDIFDTTADMNNIPVDYSNTGSTIKITPRPILATSISLNKTAISLEKGESETLIATIEPTDAVSTITWESSDETKATVDTNGKVTAIAEGTATITVKTTSNKTDICTVTVTKPVCKHINIETVPAKVPTCTDEGNNEYKTCNECGKAFKIDGITETTIEFEKIAALGHDFSIKKGNSTQHWNECSRCGSIDTKVNHKGEGKYVQDSTNHWKICSCGAKVGNVAHTPASPVKENERAATCTKEGSYNEVVYCSVCNYKILSTSKTVPATGHTNGTPVKENIVPATCTEKGSYNEVIYCTVCNEKISTTPKEIEMIPHDGSASPWENDETNHWRECGCGVKVDIATHIEGAPVKENIVPATCTKDGKYEEVVYCSVCNCEMSRTNKTDKATGHSDGKTVKENVKEATCTEEGTYDEVVYCAVCNEKLSSTPKTIPVKEHINGEIVIENKVESTTEKEGSYEEVTYCTQCKKELSRTKKVTPKFVYEILEGAGTTYQENDNSEITIRANGSFNKFEGIKVDGETVDKSNYTAKEGSTIVTLKSHYLNTLSKGEHKIALVYNDGEIGTTFNIIENSQTSETEKEPTTSNTDDKKEPTTSNSNDKKEPTTPKTDDLSNMTLWIVGLTISGILFVTVLGCKIRNSRRKGQH